MRSLTEGEDARTIVGASSPSVAFGATSPWRGRIQRLIAPRQSPFKPAKVF
jgi:hypothetical protein